MQRFCGSQIKQLVYKLFNLSPGKHKDISPLLHFFAFRIEEQLYYYLPSQKFILHCEQLVLVKDGTNPSTQKSISPFEQFSALLTELQEC